MKTRFFLMMTVVVLLCVSAFGQPDPDRGPKKGANLTEEQKAKIKEIRIASYKDIKALQNQLGELKAKQRTLTTADKPDMNAINANIDEITKVQNKIMKIKASNHQQVRALLTDEQKMWFDSEKHHKKGKDGMRMHKGKPARMQSENMHEQQS